MAKGGYVLADAPGGKPDVILMATGSELSICVEAAEKLQPQGIAAALVSMPCWELFDEQDEAYRESVLPAEVTARVAVEAGIRQGWDRYLGPRGRFVGMRASAPAAPAAHSTSTSASLRPTSSPRQRRRWARRNEREVQLAGAMASLRCADLVAGIGSL